MPTTRHYTPGTGPLPDRPHQRLAIIERAAARGLRAALCPTIEDEWADEQAYREQAEAIDHDEAIEDQP